MFATSTKTATFLPTVTPWSLMDGRCRRVSLLGCPLCLDAPRGGPHRDDGSLDPRTGWGEPQRRPAAEGRRIVRAGRFDLGATLVPGRSDDFLEERSGHPVGIVARIDDQEVDRAHEAAGPDRRTEGQDGSTDHRSMRFGDEDAGLREVDELPEQ